MSGRVDSKKSERDPPETVSKTAVSLVKNTVPRPTLAGWLAGCWLAWLGWLAGWLAGW